MISNSSLPPLRPFQKDAIDFALKQKTPHLIVHAATGSGKSRIFQDLAFYHHKKILLVSPLIALSRQHARKLKSLDLKVCQTTGGLQEKPDAATSVWIVSPESLRNIRNRHQARGWADYLVVDECHTLWEWGSDFRPSIREIPDSLKELKILKSVWLSATLPPVAIDQIRNLLEGTCAVQGCFSLPDGLEIRIASLNWSDRLSFCVQWAKDLVKHRKKGILFCPTRNLTQRISQFLNENQVPSFPYHAGFSSEERQAVESQIRNQAEGMVVVATSAFGMGMDVPDLEEVVLWQPPNTLLALAQALGRVARANRSGIAHVLWDEDDYSVMHSAAVHKHLIQEVYSYLRQVGLGDCPKIRLQHHFQAKTV